LAESESKSVRFPKIIRHRKSEATIYGKSKRYPFYRVVYRADGKRRMKSIAAYPEARKFADKKVHELAEGSKVPALTDKQAGDALAAFQRLQNLFQSTGRRISLLAGISEYCEAIAKLGERPLSECVDAYLRDLAAVRADGPIENDTEELAVGCYETVFDEQPEVLGHYFRNLYHIIKFVDESRVTDKKRYTSIVRAQLNAETVFSRLLKSDGFFEHLFDSGV
jgi:hypothetical protein